MMGANNRFFNSTSLRFIESERAASPKLEKILLPNFAAAVGRAMSAN